VENRGLLVIHISLWWVYKGGGNEKECVGKCEDYGKNRKADITFTWEKQGDGSANLVGQIMVGLFSKFSSCQIKMSL
jgi:hypothetical protein